MEEVPECLRLEVITSATKTLVLSFSSTYNLIMQVKFPCLITLQQTVSAPLGTPLFSSKD